MESKWIHCPACGHRLFRLIQGRFDIEMKCPSCKGIYAINERTKGGDRHAVSSYRMPLPNSRVQSEMP